MLEKRRQKNAFTKKRSASPEVPTEDLMGGGTGDFQRKCVACWLEYVLAPQWRRG